MKKFIFILMFLPIIVGTTMADYNFPSAMPPGGNSPDKVNQIVTFIWDDNAYSGKTGTNYENKVWLDNGGSSGPDAFTKMGWVGGKRLEGNWSTKGSNPDSLKEGDIGMSWAAYTLAGYTPEPAFPYTTMPDYTKGDHVVYKGVVYEATAWIGHGTTPTSIDTTVIPGWDTLPQWKKNAEIQKFPWKKLKELGAQTPTKNNPDGTPMAFTFNVITGFMVPTWPGGQGSWKKRESKYGYYVPNKEFYPDGKLLHSKVATSWGREMTIYNEKPSNPDANMEQIVKDGGKIFGLPYIENSFREVNTLGHELGNHTIDHMESNSPLPNKAGDPISSMPGATGKAYKDGYARWGGEGYDTEKIDVMPWGEKINEAEEFGQKDGNIWQYMGWKVYSGKCISKKAWKGAIELGEEELDLAYGISVPKGNLFSFRAPRLEVNSGMHFALKELGYLYDCGQEEGYEYYVDGTNSLWPYTCDNGSPNISWQRNIGEDIFIDSMPAGLWQYPVNAMIVPKDIRPEVWANHAIIARAEFAQGIGENPTDQDSIFWVNSSGKITGFDFNMFILWGMTKDNALKTLKYNLDQHLKGNKAPIQIGCHTDYFTPMYDYATLMTELNKKTYGLCVVNGWNTWKDRKAVFTEFVDYGLSKNVHFKSGKETIDYIKSLQAGGTQTGSDVKKLDGKWDFFKNNDLGGSSFTGTLGQDISDIKITLAAKNGDEHPCAGFAKYEEEGYFSGLSHIKLDYQTTAPLVVRIVSSNGEALEVTLGSLKNKVKSGLIPLTAFHESQYATSFSSLNGVTAHKEVNTDKIIGIEVQTQTSGDKEETHTLSLSNLTVYTGELIAPITNSMKTLLNKFALRKFTRTSLNLEVPIAGIYTVNILSLRGQLVKSFHNSPLALGSNTLNIGNLSNGIYVLHITGKKNNINRSIKAVLR